MERAQDLEKEYENKKKGTIYYKRMAILKDKFQDLVKRLETLGMETVITYKVILRNPDGEWKTMRISLLDSFNDEDVKNIIQLRAGVWKPVEIKKENILELGKIYEE